MYSNWNVLVLPMSCDGKYKVGEVFKVSDEQYWKFWRFDGLQIKNIDCVWGIRLHFDYKEWHDNKPDAARIDKFHKSKVRDGLFPPSLTYIQTTENWPHVKLSVLTW